MLIAINAHQAHEPADILACCHSVRLALSRLEQTRPAVRARIALYTDRIERLGQDVSAEITALGIAIIPCPGATNGARLNLQIEAAIAAKDALFLRVDGDDTVSETRLVHQLGLFLTTDADILGGGLTYVQLGDGRRPKGLTFDVIPPEHPRALDYVWNRFMLHPTLGLRVATLARTGLRYWDQRLEDKELLLRAAALGLRMQNAPVIYGTYFVDAEARNTPEIAALGRDLTCAYLRQVGARGLLPVAWALWVARRVMPVPFLRRARSVFLPSRSAATPERRQPGGGQDGAG